MMEDTVKKSNVMKIKVADACHRLDLLGFVAATDGNISVRIDEDRILITPSMVSKAKVTPQNILICNLEGKILSGRGKASSEIKMHLFVYRARPDIISVVHAHPPVATGFASAGRSLTEPVLPEILLSVGPVPLAKYATPSTDEVPLSIAPYIDKNNAVLLANHGVLTLGKSIDEALDRMERVEHLAKVMLIANHLGGVKKIGKNKIRQLLDTFDNI